MMKSKIIALMFFVAFLTSCASEEDIGITISSLGELETEEVPEEETTKNVSQEETQEQKKQEEVEEETTQETAGNQEIIEIEDLKFKPNEITIEKGTMVRWIHNDLYGNNKNIIHQVRVYKRGETLFSFMSNRLLFGESFNYTFNEPGEYWYIDLVFKDKMSGSITVG